MRISYHILSVLFLLLEAPLMLQAQLNRDIVENIVRQVRLFPQEKTYIHTDAADYAPGDRIWMRVYVVDALGHAPVDASRYVYVELISPEGAVASRVKIICREGLYAGYVDIPATSAGGRYLLRAYTDWMTNVNGYESVKAVYVGRVEKMRPGSRKESAAAQGTPAPILYHLREDNRIKVFSTIPDESFFLLAHCRAYPFFHGKITSRQPIVFSSDSLPQGIISLLLLDKHKNVVAEQLFFSDNRNEECRLQIVSDRQRYASGEEVELTLRPDLHPDEQARLSVSVIDASSPYRHRPSSIVRHLLLASDVARCMFDTDSLHASPESMDSLLGGERWTRYDFDKVLKGLWDMPAVPREISAGITGRVRSLWGRKPVAGATVNLISPQPGVYAHAVTGKDGRFMFSGMDFPAGTQYVLNAFGKKGNEHVELVVAEKDFPPYHMPLSATGNDTYQVIPADTSQGFAVDGIMLDDVKITAKIRNSASRSDVHAQLSDFSFGLKQIEEIDATCLHELIRQIPGVFIRENKCYVRAKNSIMGDNPAAVAIDGVFVDEDYDLDNIQMADVARVDVFKTGATVIWGSRGGSGVISITTKVGNYRADDAERANQKKITPLGFQHPSSFAGYGESGSTLYWNPDVLTDTVRFTFRRGVRKCIIVVEGVTSEGRLVHEERELLMEESR